MNVSRRTFLNGMAATAAWLTAPGTFAETLLGTPSQTAGPFYPNKLPLDTDNDLLIINDAITPAVGEITHLGGRILDARGNPIRNALVEIWQVDNNGVYIHEGSANAGKRDGNFQGFGKFLTGSSGEYYFRTIKPVPYGDSSFLRTRHIHYAVHVKGRERFTTQCYVSGEPLNKTDSVLKAIKDPKLRELVIVDFAPIPDRTELAATFDIILDTTPTA